MEIDFEVLPLRRYSTFCPRCGPDRKKANTKSLSVFRDDDGYIRVKCNHTVDCPYSMMTRFKDTDTITELPKPVDDNNILMPIPDGIDLPTSWRYGGKEVKTLYWYKDVLGRPLYAVMRTEDKKFPPLVLLKTGEWSSEKFPKVKALFGAELLPGRDRVIVVEGEKAAVAGQQKYSDKGIAVVTWRGGAKSVLNGEWSLLKGKKEVYLWPDNDEAGRAAMKEVAKLIPVNVIKILDVSKFPEKADLADELNPSDVMEAFKNAEVIQSCKKVRMSLDQMTQQKEALDPSTPTGYEVIDAHVKLPPSGLVVIEGRTGHGKSAFAVNLADNFLRADKRVVVLSYEMPASRTLARFIRRSNKELKVQDCLAEDNTPVYIKNALDTGQLEIYDQSAQITAPDLISMLDSPEYNGALVVLDYIQIIPMGNARGDKHDLIKEQLLDPIRVVANNHGFIVAALSQLTPNYGSPELDSPRECRDIHMSAEMVLRVWNRESFADHPVYDVAKGNYTIHVYKNRDGESNMIFDCMMYKGASIDPKSAILPRDVLMQLRKVKKNRSAERKTSAGGGHDAF